MLPAAATATDAAMKRRKCRVVISGATGRFPACASMQHFKDNLFNGVDLVTEDDQRWPPGTSLPACLPAVQAGPVP